MNIIRMNQINKVILSNGKHLSINLNDAALNPIESGLWKLCLISQNKGINNKNNDSFYHTVKDEDEDIGSFKNKVNVICENGERQYAHIIHWVPSGWKGGQGFFYVSLDNFWDQFDK